MGQHALSHYIRLQQRPAGWIRLLHCLMMEKLAKIMFWLITRGQWDQKIQQYNLLMSAQVKTAPNRRLRLRSVKLGSNIKRVIFESLNQALSAASCAEDGKKDSSSSFLAQKRRNKILMSHHRKAFANNNVLQSKISDIYHALKAGDTHQVLVWHVATSFCQIKLLEETGGSRGDLYALNLPPTTQSDGHVLPEYYATAVILSNYCAYLVIKALVPDNGLVANKVFDAVLEEATEDLLGCRTLESICSRLEDVDRYNGKEPTIVKIGVELSIELMSTYLGRFWAGYLLHLSANTRAAKHRVHLQGKGELTTHLWALLSHAGFLGDTTHGHQMLDADDLNDA